MILETQNNSNGNLFFSDDQKMCFGALQLVQIAQPNLNIGMFITNEAEKPSTIKRNIGTLNYSSDCFSIDLNGDNVSNEALTEILNKIALKLNNNFSNTIKLKDLLLALGEYRINRIGFTPKHKKQFSTLGEELGKYLADIAETIRYLYSDYNIKAFIVSGGFIKGKIGTGCEKGFKNNMPEYIRDGVYNDDKNKLIGELPPKPNDEVNYKIYYYSNNEKDYGLLGTAIIGFDHYIYEKKISELQEINKAAISDGKIPNNKKFLTEEEKNKFLKNNKEKLRVFLSEPKKFEYTPNKFEKELINCLKGLTGLSFNTDSDLPPILVSFETPPIFTEGTKWLEEEDNNRDKKQTSDIPENNGRRIIPPIDKLLGCYKSDSKEIVIYQRGINWCVKREGFRQECLFAVVLIHEIGHWITHVPPNGKDNPAWPTKFYNLAEEKVHEGWAQLITWWVAADKAGSEQFKETFEKLNEIQSDPYRVFEDFKKQPEKNVMQSLKTLRALNIDTGATLDDWEKALNQLGTTTTP